LDGRLHSDAEGDRLLVIEDEWGKGCAGYELIATVDSALALDWVAHLAQPIDIAAKGSYRDLESSRQLLARPVAMGL
jgi:hypothetical protein